jgi:hypothetical protein
MAKQGGSKRSQPDVTVAQTSQDSPVPCRHELFTLDRWTRNINVGTLHKFDVCEFKVPPDSGSVQRIRGEWHWVDQGWGNYQGKLEVA